MSLHLFSSFRWFGDFVLSKSCENSIVCWKSGSLDQSEKEKEQRTTIIHKLDVSISDGDYVWKLVGIHVMKGWTISDKFTYVNQIKLFFRYGTAKSGLLDFQLIWRRRHWPLEIPRARYTHGTSR